MGVFVSPAEVQPTGQTVNTGDVIEWSWSLSGDGLVHCRANLEIDASGEVLISPASASMEWFWKRDLIAANSGPSATLAISGLVSGGTPTTTPSTPQIPLEKSTEADSTISAGMPVYIKNTTHADVAITDTLTTASVAGLAISVSAQGTSVTYRTEGTLTLGDWTDAAGASTLTTGSAYYLSSLGGLTITAPTAHGSFLVHIGRAISPDTLDISIQPPIAL